MQDPSSANSVLLAAIGVIASFVTIFGLIVRYFVRAMDRKDTYIQGITKEFSNTINIHLVNENAAREKEMAALTKVIGVLDQHTQVLGKLAESTVTIVDGMKKLNQDAKRIRYGRRKDDKPVIGVK